MGPVAKRILSSILLPIRFIHNCCNCNLFLSVIFIVVPLQRLPIVVTYFIEILILTTVVYLYSAFYWFTKYTLLLNSVLWYNWSGWWTRVSSCQPAAMTLSTSGISSESKLFLNSVCANKSYFSSWHYNVTVWKMWAIDRKQFALHGHWDDATGDDAASIADWRVSNPVNWYNWLAVWPWVCNYRDIFLIFHSDTQALYTRVGHFLGFQSFTVTPRP